jgi:hypothetical protein
LQAKVKEQENILTYNRKAVENVGTSVRIKFILMLII